MIDRSLPGWAFSSATVSTPSPRSMIEFCQASASCRVLETTYLVAAFMCVVTGLPSVRRAHAVMKSCQVRRPNSMSPGLAMAWAISRPSTSSLYRLPHPPSVKPPRVSSSARPRPCTTPSRVTLIVTVIERMECSSGSRAALLRSRPPYTNDHPRNRHHDDPAAPPGDRGGASDGFRTYMMMLLIGAPVLMDDPVARRFLEQAQYLGGVMARMLAATQRPREGAAMPGDGLDDAIQLLHSAAAPLLQLLSPGTRDSIQRIGLTAEE